MRRTYKRDNFKYVIFLKLYTKSITFQNLRNIIVTIKTMIPNIIYIETVENCIQLKNGFLQNFICGCKTGRYFLLQCSELKKLTTKYQKQSFQENSITTHRNIPNSKPRHSYRRKTT